LGGLGLAQLLHLVPASDRLAQLGRDVRGEHALLGTQLQQSARRHPEVGEQVGVASRLGLRYSLRPVALDRRGRARFQLDPADGRCDVGQQQRTEA